VEAPAQVAVGERREVRVAGGQHERDEVLALVAVLASRLGCRGDLAGREAV
jgi:hypothetical protein